MKLGIFLVWLSGMWMSGLFYIAGSGGVTDPLTYLVFLVLSVLPLYFGIKRLKKVGTK